ncbi:MAG TPA: DNA-directed RNA polymerase subunit P [Thermoplasmata archaeon]|nr:DNA-directed RNA polymerase subunit P [Thermoplasmata archaeon]
MAYRCAQCKRRVEFDIRKIGMKCPYCGSKVFFAERPTIAKRIKAR